MIRRPKAQYSMVAKKSQGWRDDGHDLAGKRTIRRRLSVRVLDEHVLPRLLGWVLVRLASGLYGHVLRCVADDHATVLCGEGGRQ